MVFLETDKNKDELDLAKRTLLLENKRVNLNKQTLTVSL